MNSKLNKSFTHAIFQQYCHETKVYEVSIQFPIICNNAVAK